MKDDWIDSTERMLPHIDPRDRRDWVVAMALAAAWAIFLLICWLGPFPSK